MIGITLAHYEITSRLGKGGMGEVFQAKDLKLGRDVAIKVLPEEFARDADRVARFQREARLLASLNHPNIAAIHGLEESGGINFLVLELVEGQTLSGRINSGPVPVEDSLKLALQIDDEVMALSVESEPTFNPVNPKTLFKGAYVGFGLVEGTPWDISPDGKRFLMLKEAGSTATGSNTTAEHEPHRIHIVLNWFEELKQRVPVK